MTFTDSIVTGADLKDICDFAPEAAAALRENRPVVALESTIITHGMPFPENAEMAGRVETVIRECGAVPATIAVIAGRLKIGLTDEERLRLAERTGVMKLSRADIGFAISEGRTGGATVAATMIAAALAGIPVFATGGIGGVHKGAKTSFDISADLEELARTPVIVVSAGAKAILDIRKTLEVLETKGVQVVGYRTSTLPAFWSRRSPFAAPLRLDDAASIARLYRTGRALGSIGGMLVANPVPEADEIPADIMAGHITAAQADANRAGVSGKEVTPFLLARILELTGGASLKTNVALVENNARLAAEIANALVG